MTYKDNPDWQRIFGSAWKMMIDYCPEAGGFLIDHRSKTVYADKNLMALAGMHRVPQYEEMVQITESLKNQDDIDAQLVIGIAEENEQLTAGIIRRGIKSVTGQLPVCTQTQLVVTMTENSSPSVLALIRIEAHRGSVVSDMQLYSALTAIIGAAPAGTLIAPCNQARYWLYIPGFDGDPNEMLTRLKDAVESVNASEGRLTLMAGCGADVPAIRQRMQTAEFAFFEASTSGRGSIKLYSVERYEQQKNDYDSMRRFLTLVDNNLFIYHFQPIVKSDTGEIAAYEALMRTDSEIGLDPLSILDYADKFNRLYDIERATIRNTLKIIGRSQDNFHDKKLFVNSITAHMLSDEDWEAVEQEYGELMEKMVIELTEQTEITGDKLELIKKRLERSHIQLAIDDYGTGYSNTSNLLKYKPDYVKIDRSLIQKIDSQPKVQKLVSGIIEFIHDNGFAALAEGVETFSELKTMIGLGADYIQGYYVSRPKPVLVHEISEKIRNEIITINREMSSSVSRMYHPAEGAEVDLSKLIDGRYTGVFIETENVTLYGGDKTVNANIIIKDGLTVCITMKGVSLTSERENALISLGENSKVTLVIEGDNKLIDRGIYVPQTADLTITGNGSLYVLSQWENSYGIGTDKDHNPGNINIDMRGRLAVEVNGEEPIAIGGGRNEAGKSISIYGGELKISCSGNKCLGIGILHGNSIVDIRNCGCSVETSSPTAVGVGSLTGMVNIAASHYKFSFKMSGISLCAIGTIEDGAGVIMLDSGSFGGVLNGKSANCIGTRRGRTACRIFNSTIDLHCEGRSVSGIGDMEGSGDIELENTEMNFLMLTKEGEGIASRGGTIKTQNVLRNITINS